MRLKQLSEIYDLERRPMAELNLSENEFTVVVDSMGHFNGFLINESGEIWKAWSQNRALAEAQLKKNGWEKVSPKKCGLVS